MSEEQGIYHTRPEPLVGDALWTLRWICPKCLRSHLFAAKVADQDRITARLNLSAEEQLKCRCGGKWQTWEAGIDWQPENNAARQKLQDTRP